VQVALRLLGGFDVEVDGRQVPPDEWRRRQAAGLVKLLAMTPGRAMHREQVIDALWPDVSVDEAAPRLHKAAHYARRACGHPRALVLSGDQVSLFPDDRVTVDALAFETAARDLLARPDGPGAAEAAGALADTYPGELLPADPYEPWVETLRERLRLLHLDLLRLGRRWAALVAADPTDEAAHLELVRGLAAAGQRRAALRQFERMERELRTELGVRPSAEAIELRDALLSDDHAVAPHQRLPALHGRERELQQVAQLLRQAGTGDGGTLVVSGPAGIGKSALLTWTERYAAEHGWRTGTGMAASVEGAWPYAPVLEALADLCRRHPALLDGLADTFRAEIELALSGSAQAWSGESSHQRLFVSAAELMRLAAAGEGALLVIDDVHEADDASLRLLHFLARNALGERVLIVVGQRSWPIRPALDGMRRSLMGRGSATTMDLGPLDDDAIRTLIRTILPDNATDTLSTITTLAAGMPFAAQEMARAASSLDDGRAPLNSLVLRGIPAEVVETLRRVAVIGTAFDTDEFVAMSGLDEDEAYARLDLALADAAVERTGHGYRFRHALVRDALLDGLPPHRRQPLHRAAAESLLSLGASPARVGHQLIQAADPAAAAPYLLKAAKTEAAVGAYRDALELVDSIRGDVSGPDRTTLLALRADLLMAASDSGAVAAYREALAGNDNPFERRRLRTQLARAATFAGDYATAAAALEGLEPDGGELDSALLLARGNLAYLTGDMATADSAASEARRRLLVDGGDDWRVFDLISLQGLLAHQRGEWFQRLSVELRNAADKPELALSVFDSHLCVAEYMLYGPTPYPEVLSLAARLRESARRSGVLRAVAFATALRGEAALLMGDLDLAEAELREAAELHHEISSAAGEAHSLQRWAEVCLARGDRDQATLLLRRALPLARWSSIALHLIQRVYGTMIAAAPDPVAARAIVDRADATLGQQDSCTFCNVMVAVPAAIACADVGDIADAQRHLATAEKSAALWEGTAWQAAVLEARSHLARAMGDVAAAKSLLAQAAQLFDAAGHVLDAARCRA
jgi:DNA-binding SARP family transcriptional activator/tetratricopeptide (TPR) repeat protein